MSSRTEKPREERIKEVVTIFKKFRELGIPLETPEVQEVKLHTDAYINDGICWSGTINFQRFGRMAEVVLPRRADKLVEVTLRLPRI
jgi:hypothetical protein